MTTDTRPTADELNAHLAAGGVVQVTTCTRSVLYRPKQIEFGPVFCEKDGDLFVRVLRGWNALSVGPRLLVAVRCDD